MTASDDEILEFIEKAIETQSGFSGTNSIKVFIPTDLESRIRAMKSFMPYHPSAPCVARGDIGELNGRIVQVNELVPSERIYVIDAISLVIGENLCQIPRG